MKVAKRLECGQLAAAFGMRGPPQTPDSPVVVASSNWKTISEVASLRNIRVAWHAFAPLRLSDGRCALESGSKLNRTPNASRPLRLGALVAYPTVS